MSNVIFIERFNLKEVCAFLQKTHGIFFRTVVKGNPFVFHIRHLMRNDLPLGRYSGTGTAHLNLTLTLDQNMPEELQGLLGYVDWTLTAAQESAPTVLVRYFPQTGIPER